MCRLVGMSSQRWRQNALSLLVKCFVYFSVLCIVKNKYRYYVIFEILTSRFNKYQIAVCDTLDIRDVDLLVFLTKCTYCYCKKQRNLRGIVKFRTYAATGICKIQTKCDLNCIVLINWRFEFYHFFC